MPKQVILEKQDQNVTVIDNGAILANVDLSQVTNEQLQETINNIVSILYGADNTAAPVLPESLVNFNPIEATEEQMAEYSTYLNFVKTFKANKTANIAKSNAMVELFAGILINASLEDVSTFLLAWVKERTPAKVTVNKINRTRKENNGNKVTFASVCRKHFNAGASYEQTLTALKTIFAEKPENSTKGDLSWHANDNGYILTEDNNWVSK